VFQLEGKMAGRLQRYETDEIVVTYEPGICTHSGVCARSLFAVFNPREKRWVRLENASAQDVAATVAKCPSTALKAQLKIGEASR
jgi:uncharacterized Fe-S cluster protein YjdI